MRILFVCTGNICRSPFAEALARHLSPDPRFEFASAGTFAIDGAPATRAGITVATRLGAAMANHRATPLTGAVVTHADRVYGMEDDHVSAVLALDPGARVELLDPAGAPVADPYGGSSTEYQASFLHIRQALLQRLNEWT